MSPQSWRLAFRIREELEVSSPLQNFDACPCRFCWCGKSGQESNQESIFRSFLSEEAWRTLLKNATLLDEDHQSIEDCRPATQVVSEDAVLNDEACTSMPLSQVRTHLESALQIPQTSFQHQLDSPTDTSSEYLKWIRPSTNKIAIEPSTTAVSAEDQSEITKPIEETTPTGSSKNRETVFEVLHVTPDVACHPNFAADGAEAQLTSMNLSKQISTSETNVLADKDSASSGNINLMLIAAHGRRNKQVEAFSNELMESSSQSCRPIMEVTSEREALVQSPSIGIESIHSNDNCTLAVSAATDTNLHQRTANEGHTSPSSSEDETTLDGIVFFSSKFCPTEARTAESKLKFKTSTKEIIGPAPTVASQHRSEAPSTSQSMPGRPKQVVDPIDPMEEDLMLSDSDDNETGTDSDTSWTSSLSNDNNNRDSTDLGTSDYSETEDDSMLSSPEEADAREPASNAPVPPTKKSRWTTNGQYVHVCPECYQVFVGQEAFHLHLKTHNPAQPYKCPLCQLRFEEKKDQTKHLKSHKDGCGRFKCSKCRRTFSRISHLVGHMGSHNDVRARTYKCGICNKAFSGLVSFIRHQHNHNNADSDKKFSCGECQKHFANLISLRNHERSHNRKKSCLTAFARQMVHSRDKRYKCDNCSMSFSHPHRLKRHKRCHTSKVINECPQCSMIFPRLSDLKRHTTMRHGEKSVKCDKCSWAFTNISSLKRHDIRRHSGEKVGESNISEK